jgi:hypothetical protein
LRALLHLLGKFEQWSAAKRYGRTLGPQLCRDYGSSEHYTPGQIVAATQKLNLPLKFISLGYAVFLAETDYCQIAGFDAGEEYKAFRALMARFELVLTNRTGC